MGKKNINYTASYKLKVICFAEQLWNRATQWEFGILEFNVRYWRKQKWILKNARGVSRAFRGPKAGKSAYFTHPVFSATKLKKKCANYANKYGNWLTYIECWFSWNCRSLNLLEPQGLSKARKVIGIPYLIDRYKTLVFHTASTQALLNKLLPLLSASRERGQLYVNLYITAIVCCVQLSTFSHQHVVMIHVQCLVMSCCTFHLYLLLYNKIYFTKFLPVLTI
jgi:hypothetical protein